MRNIGFIVLGLCVVLVTAARDSSDVARQADAVIALERAALDRWGRGDPGGLLEIYAPEITYFDTATELRLNGLAAMTDYYRPFAGKIKIARYAMIDPKVQRHGNVAVLTYNLRSEAVQPDGKEVTIRWNSSSVYARIDGAWKVIHSHWSLTASPCTRGVM